MTSIDAQTLGGRIRDARKRADMSQEDLGQSVGLDRTAINKIESGIRKVTALELSEIGAALGVRMFTFFEDPVPAIVEHRSSQGLDTADSQLDALLATFAVSAISNTRKLYAMEPLPKEDGNIFLTLSRKPA